MQKRTLLLLPVLSAFLLAGCWKKTPTETAVDSLQKNQKEQAMDTQTVKELQLEDIVVGEGAEATPGALITVHYKGTFLDGRVFDTSLREGRQPFTFELGGGQVIEGWDKGVAGMKVGGTRKLTIPSDLAYGPLGAGAIPPNTPLVFEVQLLEVN